MAAGEYVIAEGVKIILDETTYRYHTYWAEDDEGFISFRVQADEEACTELVVEITAWLREKEKAASGRGDGSGSERAGILKIPLYYCYECYDDGKGVDVELSTRDMVCPQCGKELDWLDIYD